MSSVRPYALALSLVLAGSATAWAADAPAPAPADRTIVSATPDAKTSRATDRKLLAAARRVVVKDKSLSVSAHNVKMSMNNGVLTLRGGVKSAEEKDKVEELAKGVAGISSVDNQLAVKGTKTARVVNRVAPSSSAANQVK